MSSNYERKIFSKIYEIYWSLGGKLGSWIPGVSLGNSIHSYTIRKQIQRVITEVRPDVVHAHNLFAAKMMAELKQIPFIYDAHETWSLVIRRQKEAASIEGLMHFIREGKIRYAGSRSLTHFRSRLWTKWERELITSVPVLTPSIAAAARYRSISENTKVFIVPNYPLNLQVKDFRPPILQDELSCAYVGRDKEGQWITHRNIDCLTALFESHDIGTLHMIGSDGQSTDKVKYHGFLPKEVMFKELFKHSIGLIPFRKHWSHTGLNPNKAFEYAHAGLFLMCTSSMTELMSTFGENCQTFEDHDQLASQLAYFTDNMEELYKKRLKIFDFAHSDLLWEKNEHNIIEAYNAC